MNYAPARLAPLQRGRPRPHTFARRRAAAALTAALGAVCASALLSPAPAGASAQTPPGFSLSVSPARLIVPGDQLARPQQLTVTNRGSAPIQVTMTKRDFEQLPDGSPRFVEQAPYSASTWIAAAPETFALQPGQAQQVTVHITAPTNADAGEHQVAIVSTVPAPDQKPGISVSRSVAIALYVTIPGPVDDSAHVTDLHAPGFAVGGPIPLTATVVSTGTMHHDFKGRDQLVVHAHGDTIPFADFAVLRDSTRIVTTSWQNPPLFCICHTTVTIPGPGGQTSEASATVVIVPIPLLLTILGVTLLISVLAWLVLRRLRRQPQLM